MSLAGDSNAMHLYPVYYKRISLAAPHPHIISSILLSLPSHLLLPSALFSPSLPLVHCPGHPAKYYFPYSQSSAVLPIWHRLPAYHLPATFSLRQQSIDLYLHLFFRHRLTPKRLSSWRRQGEYAQPTSLNPILQWRARLSTPDACCTARRKQPRWLARTPCDPVLGTARDLIRGGFEESDC